jgi:hypothetical protein
MGGQYPVSPGRPEFSCDPVGYPPVDLDIAAPAGDDLDHTRLGRRGPELVEAFDPRVG